MSGKVKAAVTIRVAAQPEAVYDAWLDPASVRTWMSASLRAMGLPGDVRSVEIDARLNGRFLWSDMREGGEARHWGSYLELDRPRRISFTWIVDESEEADPSRVMLTIEPDGDGCHASIVHWLDADWASYIPQTENGWSNMLRAVADLLERDPR